jgi:hypothetical protein
MKTSDCKSSADELKRLTTKTYFSTVPVNTAWCSSDSGLASSPFSSVSIGTGKSVLELETTLACTGLAEDLAGKLQKTIIEIYKEVAWACGSGLKHNYKIPAHV